MMPKSMAIPLLIVSAFFFIWLTVLIINVPEIRLRNKPEQFEQVEVVGKRIWKYHHSSAKFSSGTSYTYIVSFKLPDGSVKEFKIDYIFVRKSKEEPYSPIYDALNEGDTGILTYKEREDIEDRNISEDMRFDYRLFISFEKDPVLESAD